MAGARKKTPTRKAVRRKTSDKKAPARRTNAAPEDLHAPIRPEAAGLQRVLEETTAVVERLPRPEQPEQGDLVHALIHLVLTRDVPCGYGQEAIRRIESAFVDRNEFRVTEAFEVEELLADLEIPDRFARCMEIREAISQLYNDQNAVSLDFLREATVSERTAFFQRVPAISPEVAAELSHLVSFEECIFSGRSTLRARQRLGFEPRSAEVDRFFAALRELLADFGHVPLRVGPDRADGKPLLEPALSPARWLLRLAPRAKTRRRS